MVIVIVFFFFVFCFVVVMNNYEDDDDTENDLNVQYDTELWTGEKNSLINVKRSCDEMIEIFETGRLRLIKSELIIKKSMYRNLYNRFPNNFVYRNMYDMIKEVIKKFRRREYDDMKAIVEDNLEGIVTRLDEINSIVNRHVDNNAFRDLTNLPQQQRRPLH